MKIRRKCKQTGHLWATGDIEVPDFFQSCTRLLCDGVRLDPEIPSETRKSIQEAAEKVGLELDESN